MAANPKETTAIIRENAADHALRPLFMRFEWTRWFRIVGYSRLWDIADFGYKRHMKKTGAFRMNFPDPIGQLRQVSA